MVNKKISELTGKTTPVDADKIVISDSADGSNAKSVSLVNLKDNYLGGGGGAGDVTGPASSTDNAIARFDSTTGKVLQNSGATVDDSGNLTANNVSGTNTGDETNASVKTKYEANANTNAFTDAEQTKLAGIETGAQVNTVTADSTTTFTNKSFDANGVGNSITNIETADIASGSKSGADTTLITGTAGTNGNLGQFNVDGDLVDSGVATSNVVTGGGTATGTNTGDQNLFGTIAVSGQSNVVADTTSDTLTLVAGTNVTITTDAGTDSVTINASGAGGGSGVYRNKRQDGTILAGQVFYSFTATSTETLADRKVIIDVVPTTGTITVRKNGTSAATISVTATTDNGAVKTDTTSISVVSGDVISYEFNQDASGFEVEENI